jgi:hypothetical protein
MRQKDEEIDMEGRKETELGWVRKIDSGRRKIHGKKETGI